MSGAGSVAEALARIPIDKARLDVEDDALRRELRHVEDALNIMQPGIVCRIGVDAGPSHCGVNWLSFEPRTKRWVLCWNDRPLLSTGREYRAEAWRPGPDGLTPLDRLVIKVASSLATAKVERSPMLEAARRLTAALTQAGYPPPR